MFLLEYFAWRTWLSWVQELSFRTYPNGTVEHLNPPGHWLVDWMPALAALIGLGLAHRLRLNRGGHALVVVGVLWAAAAALCLMEPTVLLTQCTGRVWFYASDLIALGAISAASVLGILLRGACFTCAGDTPRRAWWVLAGISLVVLVPRICLAAIRLSWVDSVRWEMPL